ncbi:hypothetical protein COCMIDRAFT_29145 [Bipolaris oryzae ATCC 44560]|uniref:Uncharacterized protein n=1 Tax=Bipolaris oryzae ATCC 44560 TaxID=930090 RepID=W6YRV7_COCMI|nr:uncharacterized protein COCMIDRAFT_29145 [Bipolaris oryzae ATCC 44560]EUC42172.1 hypothetical protein COCMIDRAFT_29145 [Bipolaris oryzae ATCC 44560]
MRVSMCACLCVGGSGDAVHVRLRRPRHLHDDRKASRTTPWTWKMATTPACHGFVNAFGMVPVTCRAKRGYIRNDPDRQPVKPASWAWESNSKLQSRSDMLLTGGQREKGTVGEDPIRASRAMADAAGRVVSVRRVNVGQTMPTLLLHFSRQLSTCALGKDVRRIGNPIVPFPPTPISPPLTTPSQPPHNSALEPQNGTVSDYPSRTHEDYGVHSLPPECKEHTTSKAVLPWRYTSPDFHSTNTGFKQNKTCHILMCSLFAATTMSPPKHTQVIQ